MSLPLALFLLLAAATANATTAPNVLNYATYVWEYIETQAYVWKSAATCTPGQALSNYAFYASYSTADIDTRVVQVPVVTPTGTEYQYVVHV